jgi:hypothetical protein
LQSHGICGEENTKGPKKVHFRAQSRQWFKAKAAPRCAERL